MIRRLRDINNFDIRKALNFQSACIPGIDSVHAEPWQSFPHLAAERKQYISSKGHNRAELTYYEILGVSHKASLQDIKKAFRQQAKQAHPDTLGKGRSQQQNDEFAVVLMAYQILSNTHKRELYDLSLDSRTGRLLNKATAFTAEDPARLAASGLNNKQGNPNQVTFAGSATIAATSLRNPRGRSRPFVERWIREESWAAWAASDPLPARRNSDLDRARNNLHTGFRSALRQAYLGPVLDLRDGELPECFEADERSDVKTEDILQLVSGRTLLGFVRERQDKAFAHGDLLNTLQSSRAKANSAQPSSSKGQGPGSDVSSEGLHHSSSNREPAEGQPSIGTVWQGGYHPERIVLELVVGSKPAAFGVWESLTHRTYTISIYDARGQALSVEESGCLKKVAPTAAGHTDPEAQKSAKSGVATEVTHDVLRFRTAFVKNLHFLGSSGSDKVSICRARRAQLLPIQWWIFPPRSLDHCSRSWYFEWPGYDSSQHMLWLSPYIFVLTAAFESLRDERIAAGYIPRTKIQKAAHWAKSTFGF